MNGVRYSTGLNKIDSTFGVPPDRRFVYAPGRFSLATVSYKFHGSTGIGYSKVIEQYPMHSPCR
jgi:hypothetical protein